MRRVAVLAILVGSNAYAQVLHEHVDLAAVRCNNGVCWRPGHADDGAAAIISDGEVIPAPNDGVQPSAGEPVYSPSLQQQPGAAPGNEAVPSATPLRRGAVRMDRETGPEPPGKRSYHEPFNPAIFPFKRMSALDSVRPDETLAVAPGHDQLTRLPVLGADRREPGRDAFWGSIVVDFEPQRWIPIPSVAPYSRVLAYRTEPSIGVEFAHDGAENYYVRSPAGGRHRLTWLSDAPQSYFAGDLPLVRLADEPQDLLTTVPPAVTRRALQVWQRIGLVPDKHGMLNPLLDALVEWFRGFEPGEPPPATGSTYLDLALAQKGSCRHRSYAFVITALATGIPARYVENELHVFVEVYMPQIGWRRINLGGALVEHQVNGSDGKTPYQPKGADPFPEPAEFARGTDALPPQPKGYKERGAGASSGGGRSSDGSGGGGAGMSYGDRGARVDLDSLDPPPKPGIEVTGSSTSISVDSVSAHSAFRGDRVDVSGRVSSSDGNAGGLPVEIYLDGPGDALRVGSTVSAADGSWHAAVELPRDLPLGDHRVVARTPGDVHRRASRSHGH